MTGRLASEVEDGLWELVAAGLVTADGFDNLRALVDPKRRRGEGRGRHSRPRHAAGRWALLRPGTGHDVGREAAVLAARESGNGDRIESFARQLLQRWGVVFSRRARQRVACAAVARPAPGVAAPGSARGNTRWPVRPKASSASSSRVPKRWSCCASSASKNRLASRFDVAAADPLNLVGIVTPGGAYQRAVV